MAAMRHLIEPQRGPEGPPANEVAYNAVPPGSGYRMGINRDLDNFDDGLDDCPGVPNNGQIDADMDDIGEACDPTPLPEPGSTAMPITGSYALAFLQRRRARKWVH